MNAKHTPGPWGYQLGSIIDREGYLIADVRSRFDDGKGGEDYHQANARLIAAAPNLLAALEAMIREFDVDFIEHGSIEIKQARAAIARARGTL